MAVVGVDERDGGDFIRQQVRSSGRGPGGDNLRQLHSSVPRVSPDQAEGDGAVATPRPGIIPIEQRPHADDRVGAAPVDLHVPKAPGAHPHAAGLVEVRPADPLLTAVRERDEAQWRFRSLVSFEEVVAGEEARRRDPPR